MQSKSKDLDSCRAAGWLFAMLPLVVGNAAPSPWNGTWHLDAARSSPNIGEPPAAYRFSVTPDGGLRWEIPSLGEVVTGHLDGRPMAIHRSAPTPGLTLAVRAVGPREWTYRVAQSGRYRGGGRMLLVDGGMAWVDLSWGPEGPGHGVELVYRKQPDRH